MRLDQAGQRHAERLGHLAQGAEAGVGAGALEVDEHALAHPAAGRELVEAPAALGAQPAGVAGHGGGHVLGRGHAVQLTNRLDQQLTGALGVTSPVHGAHRSPTARPLVRWPTMAALLALSAAVAYGVGDFLGGVAARRGPATVVVLWSHLVGLLMLVALAPWSAASHAAGPGRRGRRRLLGGTGVALFYRGLAVGAMSVVAPDRRPAVGGRARGRRAGSGERPTTAAWPASPWRSGRDRAGLPGRRRRDRRAALRWQALALAVGAGLAFGLFFVTIDSAGEGVGIWPLVGARGASVSLFAALGAARHHRLGAAPGRRRRHRGLRCPRRRRQRLLPAGPRPRAPVGRGGAHRPLPAGTVLLARYVLGEHLSPVQRAGLGVAGVAAVLIAA